MKKTKEQRATVTLKCIHCRRTQGFDAQKLAGLGAPPNCSQCGNIMIVKNASVRF